MLTLLPFKIILSQPILTYKTPEEYISRFKEVAIQEEQITGIPWCVLLAKAIVESQYGNTTLAVASNNHFGLKCKKDWRGDVFFWNDDTINECFRKYPSPELSYIDHSNYLMSNPRYRTLFENPPRTYQEWAHAFYQLGYATDPSYPQKIINVIEKYNLCQKNTTQNNNITSEQQ